MICDMSPNKYCTLKSKSAVEVAHENSRLQRYGANSLRIEGGGSIVLRILQGNFCRLSIVEGRGSKGKTTSKSSECNKTSIKYLRRKQQNQHRYTHKKQKEKKCSIFLFV